MSGFWKNETGTADVCQQCTSVDNALDTTESPAVYTCTSAGDTQLVGNCAENHWKNSEGDADICEQCTTCDPTTYVLHHC